MRIPYSRIARYVYRHCVGIVIASVVLSVSLGFFAAKLRIKADSADLLPQVNLFHNDTNVKWLDDWQVPLTTGDTLTVIQAVSGGV